MRSIAQLDYTPGGPSFNAASASTDIGAADEVHGESGDDFIYVGKGDDIVFGESQDDDIIGGYGNDWISGGTGDDGVIGDDGRIFTSRNGQTEALNAVTVAVVPTTVATGGNMQTADINVAGQLKKAVDLTPFSTQSGWNPATDEWGGLTQKNSDDIIFGGWGNDFLHGGSGDDAISGAEALPLAWAPLTYNANLVPLTFGRIDYARPFNPGDALKFSPVDIDGQHANAKRAGEFALYDEYNPMTKIVVNGGEYFLNFGAAEGPVSTLANANGKQTDGDDRIFGDLGNDWLVGGSGRDNLYGGFGNDLMNVDDDLSTAGGLNNAPDTSSSYEDRAYGGAGRDVLIANTGGDRLIDWTGEYNSFLVPFSPFGAATISRSLQPALMDFLYALSRSDGADFTRATDVPGGDAARNGEPWGELGLVLQKDAAWKDQHGGPADPQPGNSNGQRDVLRSANFSNGANSGFTPQVGTFSVTNDRYQVAPSTAYGDSISLFNQSDVEIPVAFEMQAVINAVKPTGGNTANAFLIFDWQSNSNFKYAGIDVSTNKLVLGERTAAGWVWRNGTNVQVKPGTDYVLMLSVNGSTATLKLGNTTVSYTYAQRIDSLGVRHGLNAGVAGIGAMGGTKAQIDDVVVQASPRIITLDKTVNFAATSPASGLFDLPGQVKGTWVTSADRFVGTAVNGTVPAVNLIGKSIQPGAMIDLQTTLRTAGQGGVVFDYHGPTYYKFVVLNDDLNQVQIGHRVGNTTVIDRTYSMSISSGNDYALGVTIRGGLVNASVNGAVVATFIYNENLSDGGYGLISAQGTVSGQSSFDIVRLRTDDEAFAPPPAALMAAMEPSPWVAATSASLPQPMQADLDAALAAARQRLVLTGIDAAAMARIDAVSVQLDDLDGLKLGEQRVGNVIVVDRDAAGFGWFVDRTPGDDSEFTAAGGLLQGTRGAAANRVDLLSVITHELGHVAGLDHAESGVMADQLAAGTRNAPAALSPPWHGADDPLRALANRRHGLQTSTGTLLGGVKGAAPTIDWNEGAFANFIAKSKDSPARESSAWVGDFVNHLAQSKVQRSPNASLKVLVPSASTRLAPALSPLSDR